MAISKIPSAGTTGFGRRNLLINGAMNVAQRGTTSLSADGYMACDRFLYDRGNTQQYTPTFSTTQDSDGPEGFANSLKIDCTIADTIAANELSNFRYRIEAQDLQHLLYGTSNAKAVTLSFWVKSNQTADFSVALYQDAGVRAIGSTYTINDADTWEYKTITFAGDTGGTINDDNGTGLQFLFGLNVASEFKGVDNTSWGAYVGGKFAYGHTATIGSSTSDYLQITGVQLEVGTVATEFENRSYGEELQFCQRYFYKTLSTLYGADYGSNSFTRTEFPVEMRAFPTITGTNNKTVISTYHNTQRIQFYLSGNASALTAGATADAEL